MGCIAAVLVTGLTTVLCSYVHRYLDHSNLIMLYLLSLVYIAARFGRIPSILASLLAVAEFDYFCVPPHYSFAVSDTQYIITLAVMLIITMMITALTSELQSRDETGRLREKRSEAVRALSTEMSLLRGRDNLIVAAMRHVRTFFDAMVGIFLQDASGTLCEYTACDQRLVKVERQSNEMALWTFHNKQKCGLGIEPFALATSLYLPLIASQGVVGVLQVSPRAIARATLAEDLELLETLANQTALCIEVAVLSERAQAAALQIEREQLRNVLLSSVSHDLRTPLATITGASSSLVEDRRSLNDAQKQELAEVILEEAEHLNDHVRNLLEMTKLESGPLTIKKRWHSIEETVGACMTRLEHRLTDRQIHIQLPADLPLVPYDEILIQQVFLNLLENAMTHTPPGSDIEIDAHVDAEGADAHAGWIAFAVMDRGPGLKPGEEEKIFAKFYRSAAASQHTGVGLGLAICRAIVKAHGGIITAANRKGGGAEFRVKLPLAGMPPASIIELDPDGQESAESADGAGNNDSATRADAQSETVSPAGEQA
jgi:two-component system, OmpR family, sensor histidine kinase KdpD